MKIAFIGFGALGKQLFELLEECYPKISEIVYFDDKLFEQKKENAFPFSDYLRSDFKAHHFYLGLGYRHLDLKNKIIKSLHQQDRATPAIIHPSSIISKSATISSAVYIYPMCNVGQNTIIQTGTLLNNSVVISHDNQLGECCYLSPGVITSGEVKIGSYTFVGSGSIVSNHIEIGKNAIIGIGTVVTGNLPDHSSAIGNPMRILEKNLTIN